MIELRGAGKRYDGHQALAPTDLRLASGRTTVLIGPSGCGKSTLLKLVVGLEEPSCGEVWVQGERVSPRTVLALRRRLGYVIQEGGLFPHLTAARNVTLMARELGWPAGRCRQRLDELCELAHLRRELLSKFPAELSGGERQRVSLMRALMLDPSVLLLDEPLGALDPMIRASLQADLKCVFEELGKTVVLVTHDLAEAAFLGEDLVLMHEGAVVQQGSLGELRERPASPFVTEFFAAQRSLAWA